MKLSTNTQLLAKTMKDLKKTAQTSLEGYPALHIPLIPPHTTTATECDKKQRGACWILNF